ncbi:uncharacterized protein LOC130731462 isoform X2 [Lotus japonicus]|uniref:uncharacterized protein LOC130731462 isoform X2 n=1 Tax=Lotus japonicus TaxID=34305 RepID=UPI002583432B|nr:uncharacterized protein LOC130731462 isoform X2 [Lotus japonicus]
MPLLEMTLRAPMPSSYYHAGRDSSWKSMDFDKLQKENFNVGRLNLNKFPFLIKAVATCEPDTLLPKHDKCDLLPNPHSSLDFSDDEPEVALQDCEKLRRMRISKANKGNMPWNKGRKHSAETIQKIKERTRLAMQNPKVKLKLKNLGHAQTTETKQKIGAGVKLRWERRRGMKVVQETCCFEWQNLIAEGSRQGYVGQEELQWNSYEILDEQLKQEWLVSIDQRKRMPGAPGSKRAPKSPEQRRKIAEAIAAKWADPEYRDRVCSALAKYHGIEAGAERKPRRRPSDVARPAKRKTTTDSGDRLKSGPKILNPIRLRKSKSPAYIDPLVNSKLEMIKNIRAQRASEETRQTHAIERARLLIAEAEKAAKALEVAATKSSIAQSSLIETRKLIAEAIQTLESIDTQGVTESNVPSVGLDEISEENGSAFKVLDQSQMAQVNGHSTLSSSDYKFSEDFGEFPLEKPVIGDQELHLTNGCASLPYTLISQMNESSPSNEQREAEQDHCSERKTDPSPTVMGTQSLEDGTLSRSPTVVTRKWVRGRLVEVAEEEK